MRLASVKSNIKLTRVEVALKKALRDPKLLREIGQLIKQRIYQFTKRGISLVTEDKLLPLSPGYVKYRRSLNKRDSPGKAKFSGFRQKKLAIFKKKQSGIQTGSFFSPARSNLTLTGQMLDALVAKTDSTNGQVVVTVKDSSRKNDDQTNFEVAQKVAKAGRPFIGIDAKGQDIIRRKVIADLRRKLKR